jgi:hypothetical protein
MSPPARNGRNGTPALCAPVAALLADPGGSMTGRAPRPRAAWTRARSRGRTPAPTSRFRAVVRLVFDLLRVSRRNFTDVDSGVARPRRRAAGGRSVGSGAVLHGRPPSTQVCGHGGRGLAVRPGWEAWSRRYGRGGPPCRPDRRWTPWSATGTQTAVSWTRTPPRSNRPPPLESEGPVDHRDVFPPRRPRAEARQARLLTQSQAKQVNAVLLTCGTYDAAGDFAYRVGLRCAPCMPWSAGRVRPLVVDCNVPEVAAPGAPPTAPVVLLGSGGAVRTAIFKR